MNNIVFKNIARLSVDVNDGMVMRGRKFREVWRAGRKVRVFVQNGGNPRSDG